MSDFECIDVTLRASDSNGDQVLHLAVQDGDEYFFTLTGRYEGRTPNIQIDFDMMNRSELEDLRDMMNLILESGDGT